ncbi:Aquaporin-1 [Sphaceloma murrayae]|uniref:Aquaporin-1 n=1 Tax=Sphaceloma murrayae TaxID=2082308 RepID=A0A2K1R1J9_9PEZI|nr:Aquaporin-1 [Sphaceloma murrayae]
MEKNTPFSSAVVSEVSANEVRQRRMPGVAEEAFAGRLGGNQEFILDRNDEDTKGLLKRHPDAAPIHTFADILHLEGFLSPGLWRMAIVEGWGTFLLICLFGTTSSGLTTLGMNGMATSLYASLGGFLGLMLFTFALGPVSGAHLNPTITMAAFFAGLCTFPRTVLYIAAQSIGGIVAGYWLKLGLGDAYYPHNVIPGCTVDPTLVSPGQMFALEYMFAQALIFLAFLIGLDPRQGKSVGPTLGPVLVGLILGFGTFASAIARPGYTGMSFNPARCLGMMAAKGDMQYHYVHWLGPFAATFFHGIFYHFNPPWASEEPLFGRALAFFGLWHPPKDSDV